MVNLKTYALALKKELQENPTDEMANDIALRIATVEHSDGSPVTDTERDHILNYLRYDTYDHITGNKGLFFGDNSEFLKLVALVAKSAKGGK